jgi:alkyl hydroperoxide reductase subunit AhpC
MSLRLVIDPRKRIRLTITYPQTAGRNLGEILRVIDSLSSPTPTAWPPRRTGSRARTRSSSLP